MALYTLGVSTSSVSLPIGAVTVDVVQSALGYSSGIVTLAAAAFSLTIAGGHLGSSVGAGSIDCAALDLAMTTNFQGSVGAAEIDGSVARRLAEYATVSPAVPGSPATVELDFTNYNGTDGWSLTLSGDTQFFISDPLGTPGVPGSPMPVFADWTGSTAGAIYTYTSNDNQDTESYTGPSIGDITAVFTQGVADIAEVVELAQAASDGFVIDAPLWPGIQEVTFATGSGTGILRGTEKALSLWEAGREVYSLWGYEIADLRLITYGRESIVNWCNAAMQLIYSNAHRLDYFNRDVLELAVTTSGTVALPANVQLVQGPARIGTAVLSTLASRAEYDHFAALYVGDSSLASPIAFYVEPLRGTGSDSVGLTLNLAPLQTDTVTVRLDVTLEPPRYDVVDLLQATILQLPHKWAETIFLPIVRKWACGDTKMSKNQRAAVIPQIDEQFAAARQMLGLADIEPPAQSKTKPEKQGGAA